MRVNQRALHAALKELSRVTAPTRGGPISSQAIMSHILVHSNGPSLTLKATDLNVELSCLLPANGEGLQDFCVEAQLLSHIVAPADRRHDTQVDLQMLEDEYVQIQVDGMKSALSTTSAEHFPQAMTGANERWQLLTEWPANKLRDVLSYTLMASSNDRGRQNLCAILFDTKRAVATDGHRLHLASLPGPIKLKMLINKHAASLLHRLLKAEGLVRIGRCKNRLRFHIGPWLLETMEMEEVFPDYRQVLPRDGQLETELRLQSQVLLKSLRHMARLSSNSNVEMRVNGALSLSANSIGQSRTEMTLQALENNHHGDDLVVGFNVRYLLDAIKGASDTLKIAFANSQSAARIEMQDGKVAVVMPVKI